MWSKTEVPQSVLSIQLKLEVSEAEEMLKKQNVWQKTKFTLRLLSIVPKGMPDILEILEICN